MLLAAFAAPPAQANQANDILAATLSAISAGSPQSSYGTGATAGSSTPAAGVSTPPPQQQNTTTNTQTAAATGGAGGSATGGTAQTPHGGNADANGGNAGSHSVGTRQSSPVSERRGSVDNGGSDVLVLETTKAQRPGGADVRGNTDSVGARTPAAKKAPSAGPRPPRGEREKALPSGGRPGHDGELPDQSPFFSVLSGSGGSSAGLMMLLLAILGALIALPRQRLKDFRMPAVTWRPPAYVPPIELPG